MALRINTNIPSLQAQRQLAETGLNVKKTLERLSSGFRLNRSADGSAEFAVSDKLNTQARGTDQAVRNAQMGINYLQTGDYGLNTMASMVQRIRELVIQAANDSYTDDDRKKIQEEINQLKFEIDRVAETTEFNGNKIFNLSQERIDYLLQGRLGGKADISFIIDNSGSMAGEIATVAANLINFTNSLIAQKIDFRISVGITHVGGAAAHGDNVDGINTIIDSNNNAAGIQATIAAITTVGGSVSTYNAMLETAGITATGADPLSGVLDTYAGTDAVTRRANVRYFQIVVTDTFNEAPRGVFAASTEAQIGNILATNGVTVYGIIPVGQVGNYNQIIGPTGGQVINMNGAGAFIGGGNLQTIADSIAQSVTNPGELLVDKGAIQIQVASAEGTMIGIDRPHITHQSIGLLNVDVTRAGLGHVPELIPDPSNPTGPGIPNPALQTTAQSFDNMIVQCDNALENIAVFRTNFGAIENRLTQTVERLAVTSENTRAALSRIKDADYAAETANLTKMQILQQAGTAVLSQANVTPQNALRSIQG